MELSPTGRVLVVVNGARGVKGDPSGPLGAGSVTANTISTDAGERAAIADLLGALRSGANFSTSIGSDNPENYVFYIQSVSQGKQVDGILATANFLGASAAGYPFHGIAYADANVPGNAVGGVGGAIGGPGPGSGVVGNRRENGPGHGVIGTRAETGTGAGVVGTAQGTGTNLQVGVRALKQNSTGAPGGPSAPGSALEVINSAEQGYGIECITLANNASDVSNFYERRNVTKGIVSRKAILLGGTRTAALTVSDILIQPASALTGSFPVTGQVVTIRAEVTGANQTSGVSISNAASGNVFNYGIVANVVGTSSGQNVAGRFSATGAIENYSIDCGDGIALFRDGVRLLGLPVYADNAAAAAGGLGVGDVYRKPDGTLMVAYSV